MNIDGATCGSLRLVTCVGFSRGSMGEHIGNLFAFLWVQNILYIEINRIILVIKHHSRG